jgi:hypothetical protein
LKKPVLEDEETIEDDVTYTVSGAIENVYSSLVVLLGYTQTFTRTDQWHNQARYEMGDGLVSGFRQHTEIEGELDLVLYFGRNVGKPVRTLFRGLFESFLARHNLNVFYYEPLVCSKGHSIIRSILRDEIRIGSDFVFCSKCGEQLPLPKATEPIQLMLDDRVRVNEQRGIANKRTIFEQAIFRLVSFVDSQQLTRPKCFISYAWGNKEQERWVERNLATDLQKAGIRVVLDRWESNRVGLSLSRFINAIPECSVVIAVGTPLYLEKFKNKTSEAGNIVAAEVDLINQRLLGTEEEKQTVLPVLLEGVPRFSLPALMWDRVHKDFRNQSEYFSSIFELILDIYGITHTEHAVLDLLATLRSDQSGSL